MVRLLLGTTIVSLLLAATSSLFANEAPPPEIFKPKPQPAGLQIEVKIDPQAKVSRLILPPEAAGNPGAVEIRPESGIAPPPDAPRPNANDGSLFESPTRTVLAGLFLSLAIGAVCFVPRMSGAAQLLLVGVMGASGTGFAALALANVAPPEFSRPPPAPLNLASGPVKVEWTGRKGAPIVLILAGEAPARGVVLPPQPRIDSIPAPRVAPPKTGNLPNPSP